MEVLHRKQDVVQCVNMWERLCRGHAEWPHAAAVQARDPGTVGEADLGPLLLLF